MVILFIGDIVGRPGREAIIEQLPKLRTKYKPDFIVANGENLASGKGITPRIYEQLMEAGIDLLTGGNHTLKRPDVLEIIDNEDTRILRPANWADDTHGWGFATIKRDSAELQVINLQGQVFMEKPDCTSPFEKADEILKEYSNKFTIIDIHAEATSEKRALAEYLDGRVSAVIGTHTHVATCDAQVLKNGTGFITDVGMTGPEDSILGVKKELVIKRFMVDEKQIFEVADNPAKIHGVVVELDDKGKCKKLSSLSS